MLGTIPTVEIVMWRAPTPFRVDAADSQRTVLDYRPSKGSPVSVIFGDTISLTFGHDSLRVHGGGLRVDGVDLRTWCTWD